MTLITRSDDERLLCYESGKEGHGWYKGEKTLVRSLRAALSRAEELKRIGEGTTCCVYCGERFSRKEPIESCDKHPLKYWIGQAELYKSEFLGRDAEWKKEQSAHAEFEKLLREVVCAIDAAPSETFHWQSDLYRRIKKELGSVPDPNDLRATLKSAGEGK